MFFYSCSLAGGCCELGFVPAGGIKMSVAADKSEYSRIGGELRGGLAVLIIRYNNHLTTHTGLISQPVQCKSCEANQPACGAYYVLLIYEPLEGVKQLDAERAVDKTFVCRKEAEADYCYRHVIGLDTIERF